MKKKQQQLQVDQDLLNDRWTNVLAAEEYNLERPTKSYPKRKLLPQFDDEALLSPYNQSIKLLTSPTDRHVDGTDRLLMPNTSPRYIAVEARR